MVAGDVAQLSRVFDNLIENGIRFSPQGGQVTVTIKAGPNNTGMVAVADKGIGIPADKLPRVWEKFYQVDATSTRKYGGTGIGLTVVKQVIDGHGGKVWAESEPGKGSVFYFSLVRV
jgi:signal transduction histidine kinase